MIDEKMCRSGRLLAHSGFQWLRHWKKLPCRKRRPSQGPEAGHPAGRDPAHGMDSWDGYGTTVKEVDVKANAKWLAEHLKSAGWHTWS